MVQYFNASVRGMQGVAAKNDASYDLSRACASVTGQTTIAASTVTTSLPNGRIVTRGCPAPSQWRSVVVEDCLSMDGRLSTHRSHLTSA